jgi:hypothetical protein
MSCDFTEEEIRKLFGSEAAEDEYPQRLKEYFFKAPIYEQIISDIPLRIVVGHKGIGKSALFKIAMIEDANDDKLSILIKPDDISNLNLDNPDFLALIRDWKLGLIEIIVTKVLSSFSSDTSDLKSWILAYGGKIIDMLKDFVSTNIGIKLDPAKQAIVNSFLKNNKIYIYIDDLDRGWQGTKNDIRRISALLNSVRDLSNETPSLYFRIGLRSDVYYLVRTSDESTDKIEGSVIWLKWSNHEIFCMLVKRIEAFFGRSIGETELSKKKQDELSIYLRPIFTNRFEGKGHWDKAPTHRVMMSLIRKRPRDLVKLCTLAARHARESGNKIITTTDFESIFEEYSQGRLQDTINEFSSELSTIEKLLLNMRQTRKEKEQRIENKFSTDQLLKKIDNLNPQSFVFANNKRGDNKSIAAFLYKINFITARKDSSEGIIRKFFEENRYISSSFVDFGFEWEIHPAYRWALQPDDINSLFDKIELSYMD